MRRFWIALLLLVAGLCLIVPGWRAGRSLASLPAAPVPDAVADVTENGQAAANAPAASRDGQLETGAPPLLEMLPKQRPPTPARAAPRDLVGGNFPISSFADAVSGATNVNNPDAVYDPVRNRFLAVWRGEEGATDRNIYGRFVSAAGVMSPTIMLLVNAPADQANPVVAYEASAGQFWVVWEDGRAGTLWQVYARRFSSDGAPVGDEILVSASTIHASNPRLVCGGGRCVIVWMEWAGDETVEEVYARAFGAAGSPLGAPVRVSSAGSWAIWPDVAHNSTSDQYLVVWTDKLTSADWNIKGRVLDSSLLPVGAAIDVSTAIAVQALPRAAYGATNSRYCVVWQDGRSGTNWDVYGQILTPAGARQGVALAVYAGPYHDGNPSIAASNDNNEFLVSYGALGDATTGAGAYFEARASTVTGAGAVGQSFVVRSDANHRSSFAVAHRAGTNVYLTSWMDTYFGEGDIMGQLVLSNRTLAGNLLMICAVRKGQEWPSVAYNTQADTYMVVWADFRSGQDYDIYGRLLSGSGAFMGAEIAIATDGQLNQNPSIAYNPQRNEYLVVWGTIRDRQNRGFDMYFQRLSAAGTLLGGPVLISSAVGDFSEGFPRVTFNDVTNEYAVAWHIVAGGTWDIYVRRISGAGAPVGNALKLTAPANQDRPHIVSNHQQNEYLVIWQESGGGEGLRGQRITGAGVTATTPITFLGAGIVTHGYDVAANAGNGGYLLVWAAQDWSIFGRYLDAAGAAVGADFAIASVGSDAMPMVAYNGRSGDYLVVWQRTVANQGTDLYARRVSATGGPSGDSFVVAAAPEFQSDQELAANSLSGEALIVWQDFRQGNWDIYGQRWIPPDIPTATPTSTTTPTITPTPTITRTPTRTATPTRTPTRVLMTPVSWLYLPVIVSP